MRRVRPAPAPLPAVRVPEGRPLLPTWLRRVVAYGLALLVGVAVCWVAGALLLHLWLVSATLAVAVLVAALLWPFVGRLRRLGVLPAVAALVPLLLLVSALAGFGLLVWIRVNGQVGALAPSLTEGIDSIRAWLTQGPLHLDGSQVDELRDQAVGFVYDALPSPVAGARTALNALAMAALAVFTVFFLLKDGPAMWRWFLERAPQRHRDRLDGAGGVAWHTLQNYVMGVAAVALVDAALIGTALFLLDVPLWLSLTLLTFVGAFVPILGATVSGVVAVLVTLVTNGATDAAVVLAAVLAVQQVEGNLLQPLVMGRALHLHPVVVLVSVTCGTLLLGVPGAVLAVPLVAVCYQVAEHLRTAPASAASARRTPR